MAEATGAVLRLRYRGLRAIRELAEAAWPHEACGLLVGRAQGRIARVQQVISCRNEHEQPRHRYRIDPEALLRVDRAAEDGGRRVVGVWHSHPNGEAYLSDTDREQAWPDWYYLVAAVDRGRLQQLRVWYLDAAGARAARFDLRP